MSPSAQPTTLGEIAHFRELYRREMNCQIMGDSFHTRPGWTKSWLLQIDNQTAGYGSIAIAGPWKDKPTAFEFFILPHHRLRPSALSDTSLSATNLTAAAAWAPSSSRNSNAPPTN